MKRPVFALAAVLAAGLLAARERTGVVRVSVVPERADWTCASGVPVRFHVNVGRDGHAVAAAPVKVACGPEQVPPTLEKTAAAGAGPALDRRAGRER